MGASSETWALLVTDVVDSTRLTERLGDARMTVVWLAHDRAVRDLLPVHRGIEADRTDGFLLLFGDVADAVRFAVAFHREMARIGEELHVPFRARVGVHWGPVIRIETTADDRARGAKPLEVEGIAKPMAARVMSVAEGGQTLLTPEARLALGPTPLRVESHGHWRMKGLTEPIELFEAGDDAARFAPPADSAKVYRVIRVNDQWIPVKTAPHHLPAERDVFVGRDAELGALARRLDEGARLVSVLGIGGTGKTRLLIRYGWTWLGDWPGGVWFCDLSETRDADGVASAVALAMGVPLGRDNVFVQLGHAIASRGRCLVILDNFEQITRHGAATVGVWLDRAPEAAFVVTSREVLGLVGEVAVPLDPLPPADSASLFVARARAAKADFALSDGDRLDVDALVRLLDGLPLAIELAAARARLMSPKAMLQRMSERFALLASPAGRPARQATLRNALDWSWDLLSADERAALAQVSQFEGGFTLEAAEAVLALKGLWPTDAVQALLDKSLVRRVSEDRFDLLVSVQEYAAGRLLGDERAGAEARHGEYYGTFGAEAVIEALDSHGGVERRRRLVYDLDNFLAASRRAVARGDGDLAQRALRAAWPLLELRGPLPVALELADAILALPALSSATRANAEILCGHALRVLGRGPEAIVRYRRAAEVNGNEDTWLEMTIHGHLGVVFRELGRVDEAAAHYAAALAVPGTSLRFHRVRGVVLGNLGILENDLGHPVRARALYAQALVVHRELGHLRAVAVVLSNLGNLEFESGMVAAAQADYEEALALHRQIGNARSEAIVLGNLATLLVGQGFADEAQAHYERALGVHRSGGNRRMEGATLANLASLHLGEGRLAEADARFEAARLVAIAAGDRRLEGIVYGDRGLLRFRQGDASAARRDYDAALAIHREVHNAKSEGVVLGSLAWLLVDEGRLDDARAALDAGERLLRDASALLEVGVLLCVRVRLARAAGDADADRDALLEVERLALHFGAGPRSELGRALRDVQRR